MSMIVDADRKTKIYLTEKEQNNLDDYKLLQKTKRYENFVEKHGHSYTYKPTKDYLYTHMLTGLGPQLIALHVDGYDIKDYEWAVLREKINERVNAELSDKISALISDIVTEELSNHGFNHPDDD